MHFLILSLLFFIMTGIGIPAETQAGMPVSSPFGWRLHPISGEWKFHTGTDLAYDYGTAIPSCFDGVVVFSGDAGDGFGNQIVIYHSQSDCYTRYAHCMSLYASLGEAVIQGQVIAAVGSTGNSTGPHLHIEFIVPDGAGGYRYEDPMLLWP